MGTNQWQIQNPRAPGPQFLSPAVGQEPIKFIWPEFVSYVGERGVLCVRNGSDFCTPVLMNMSYITFEFPGFST